MSGDFSPEQKRYLEGFTSGLQIARLGPRIGKPAAGRADRARCRASRSAQDRTSLRGGKKLSTTRRSSSAMSIRSTPTAAAGAGGEERAAQARRQFPLALLRPVLRRAGAELLHVPAAHPERHPHAIGSLSGLADLAEQFAGGYSHVTTRANFQIREIEPKNAIDLLEGDRRPGPVLARHRRRQHPQRHRHADRRHRSAGAARHAALCARPGTITSSIERGAVRPAAQVQRRVRRRRAHPGAGGHQRHRLPGGRGEGRLRRRARRLVPARARRHHRPPRFRARHRRDRASPPTQPRWRTPSSACSAPTATAPTATRRG